MANGKKAAAPRRKYVKGRKYEQGYLDRLKESVGMRHRGKKKQSLTSRAKEARGAEKAFGRRPYRAVDNKTRRRK